MAIGERIVLPLEAHNSARGSANYLKTVYGSVYSVKKVNGAIEVTRMADKERNPEVSVILLQRNGFLPIPNERWELKRDGLRLSYSPKEHRLVFEWWRNGICKKKDAGTIEMRTMDEFQRLLDLLSIDIKLKY